MVAGILAADGYRVTEAATVRDAQAELRDRDQPVQLLIANLVRDGVKFARQLHRRYPALRVLCTGCAEEKIRTSWLPPGRLQRIHKPYALSELLKAVRKLLDA
jgi:DNA-binding response OmpR family regulator